MNISVVIPVYNEEGSLKELITWIKKVMEDNQFSWEAIIIDDGSRDNSWQKIELLQKDNPEIKGIKFKRNYGKAAALHCGFDIVKGDVVITMDSDLQDSPDEIPELYNMITKENYDLVSGWKKKRHDPLFTKNIPSKLYNWTVRQITGIKLHDMNCGLELYKKYAVKNIELYGEMHRYIPVLAKWAGYNKIGEKAVTHYERKYGVSKFGLERFIRGPLDLMSVMFMTRFVKRPMHFFGVLGIIMVILGIAATIWIGIQKMIDLNHGITGKLITQSPYFYIALTSMIIGAQFFLAGFLGELVSRSSYDRNKYQIEKTTF